MYFCVTLFTGLLVLVSAAPTPPGVQFNKRALPTLTLPYGTWEANSYNAISDMLVIPSHFHYNEELRCQLNKRIFRAALDEVFLTGSIATLSRIFALGRQRPVKIAGKNLNHQ